MRENDIMVNKNLVSGIVVGNMIQKFLGNNFTPGRYTKIFNSIRTSPAVFKITKGKGFASRNFYSEADVKLFLDSYFIGQE